MAAASRPRGGARAARADLCRQCARRRAGQGRGPGLHRRRLCAAGVPPRARRSRRASASRARSWWSASRSRSISRSIASMPAPPDYISAARRDPDGTAIRIALTRKVKINTIAAAERLYVDLLPDTWKGIMPGLPQEVIDELARRAREAERQLRAQRHDRQAEEAVDDPGQGRQPADLHPLRVRNAGHGQCRARARRRQAHAQFRPAGEMGFGGRQGGIAADAGIDRRRNRIRFRRRHLHAQRRADGAQFREDRSIVVDIGLEGAKAKQAAEQGAEKVAAAPKTVPAIEPPETVPAKDAAVPDQPPKSPSAPPTIDAAAPAPAAAPQPAAKVTPPPLPPPPAKAGRTAATCIRAASVRAFRAGAGSAIGHGAQGRRRTGSR